MLKTRVKVFVPGRTSTLMIYLVHICYDDRYRLQSDIQQYTRPCLDLKVKVTDLEIFNIKVFKELIFSKPYDGFAVYLL